MSEHVIIDGNNLLYAMHAHASLPNIGRETLVRIIERWAAGSDRRVTLVFDGPVPREGLARQMGSKQRLESGATLTVRFSAPATADDVIVQAVHDAKDPGAMRVVSSDRAIGHAAKHRRCRLTLAADFVAELLPEPEKIADDASSFPEKPTTDAGESWLDTFGFKDSDDEPFDGFDAMTH